VFGVDQYHRVAAMLRRRCHCLVPCHGWCLRFQLELLFLLYVSIEALLPLELFK